MIVTIKGMDIGEKKLVNSLPLEVSGILFHMRQRLAKYDNIDHLFSTMLNGKTDFTREDIEKCLASICNTFGLTGATLDWTQDPIMTFDYYEYKIIVR